MTTSSIAKSLTCQSWPGSIEAYRPYLDTIATAIRIGNPANRDKAIAGQQESFGSFNAVTDAAIQAAYRQLACQEGIFCEPASAASIAGLSSIIAKYQVAQRLFAF